MPRVGFLLVLALVVAAPACGGSAASTAPSASAASGSTAPKPTDRQRAEAMTPRLSDFPDGWARYSTSCGRHDFCAPGVADLVKTADTIRQGVVFQQGNVDSLAGGATMFRTGRRRALPTGEGARG